MTRKKAQKPNHNLVAVELSVDHWKMICATIASATEQLNSAKTEGFGNTARNEMRRQLADIRETIENDVGLEAL